MRSRRCQSALSHRTAGTMLLLCGLLAVSSGCQHSRSFFQMDSNSRSPYFGVDLAPRWGKKKSSVEGVSRLQDEPIRIRQPAPKRSAEPSTASTQRPDSTEQPSLELPNAVSSKIDASTSDMPVELFR